MDKAKLEALKGLLDSTESETVTVNRKDLESLVVEVLQHNRMVAEKVEFRKEAREYEDAKISFFLWLKDWDNPDDEALKLLHGKAEELLDEAEERDISEEDIEQLKAFVDGKKTWGEENEPVEIKAVVDICKQFACDEPLSMEHEHLFSIPMTVGGPYYSLDFHVTEDGELDYAESVYGSGGHTSSNRLPEEVAEDLWEIWAPYFEDKISESRSPRY